MYFRNIKVTKMDGSFEIKSCEVCGNHNLDFVLNLGLHPLCDDLVPIGDTRHCRMYPIEILFCNNCITAHQRYQVAKNELFPPTYHYRSRFTADVLSGMLALVNSCENYFTTLAGKKVLDIGCNDGSLLNFFRTKGCFTIGIEPTDAFIDAKLGEHVIYNDFLSVEIAETILKNHGKPDIITFTNVFAHIENLAGVIAALKLLMSPNTMIVIENHYLGSVLELNQFDTFYHEHPRNYSYTSFVEIAKNIGTTIKNVEFPSRYNGNIRVFLGGSNIVDRLDIDSSKQIMDEEKNYLKKFETLRSNITKWQSSKSELIEQLIKLNEKIPGKAFPGRAAILIRMLGLDEHMVSSVFEKPGSMKIGHYVPGTRIPILSDEDFFSTKEKPSFILNFAWHISSEIKTYLLGNGFEGKVIDILSNEDFIENC